MKTHQRIRISCSSETHDAATCDSASRHVDTDLASKVRRLAVAAKTGSCVRVG